MLISEIESKLKPVILSPQLISSAAIKKQKIVSPNQIIEFNDFFFFILNKIKKPNIDEIKYCENCNYSNGPSSFFNKSNQVDPTTISPKGKIYINP